ncbi:MAG: hypothetical protein GY720_08840 [bacterium]|nr:hypothetical protein [bacterium]
MAAALSVGLFVTRACTAESERYLVSIGGPTLFAAPIQLLLSYVYLVMVRLDVESTSSARSRSIAVAILVPLPLLLAPILAGLSPPKAWLIVGPILLLAAAAAPALSRRFQ